MSVLGLSSFLLGVAELEQQKSSSFPTTRTIPPPWWCLQFFVTRSGAPARISVSPGRPSLQTSILWAWRAAGGPSSSNCTGPWSSSHPVWCHRNPQSRAAGCICTNLFVRPLFPLRRTCLFVLFVRAHLPRFSVTAEFYLSVNGSNLPSTSSQVVLAYSIFTNFQKDFFSNFQAEVLLFTIWNVTFVLKC